MSKNASAKRYAKALLEVAKDQQAVSAIKEQYGALVAALHTHNELQMLLTHPQVEPGDKKAMLTGILKDAHPYFTNFLLLLVDKGREAIIAATFDAFVELIDAYEGVVEATITASTVLDDATVQQITDSFAKQLGKRVRAKNNVDSSLLGGVVVRIGDRLYDGSVKGRLDRLSKNLTVS